MFFLVLFVITGVFAPLIAPHDPERGGLRDRNLPPAWEREEALNSCWAPITWAATC